MNWDTFMYAYTRLIMIGASFYIGWRVKVIVDEMREPDEEL